MAYDGRMTDPGDRPRSRTETFELAISGLLTKRADTFGEMLRLRNQLVEIESDLAAMDRVLATLGYKGDLEAVPPRPVRDAPFGRGQVMRAILDFMREAGEPLAAGEIARGAFGEANPSVSPEALRERVSKALQRLKRDGTVRCAPDGTGNLRWALSV